MMHCYNANCLFMLRAHLKHLLGVGSIYKMSKLDIKYSVLEEEFAYSMGIQAYIYGLPLTILERERRIRLDQVLLDSQKGIAPVAVINDIGHMEGLTTSSDILPYTPNNDTVYSGALLELVDEPVILTAPDILDRYWSVEVADTFTENRFYVGSRTTDGYGGNFAFVGPNFIGDLPDNVVPHKLPYNSVMFALRIAVDKNNQEESTKQVQEYQKKFKLTSLSNWNNGKEGAAVPASIKAQPDYTNPLGFFQLIAGLMIDNPPSEKHAAQVEPFKYIGLVAGKPFLPDQLSKPTQAGLARAAKMGPDIISWKVKYRGTPYETRWNKLREGTYDFDYLDRAAGAMEGLFVHDYIEAVYYSTYESYVPSTIEGQPGTGEFFNSTNKYAIHFDSDQLPDSKLYGFWSLTMYGPDFQLVDNIIDRYSISDRTAGVVKNSDGSLDLYFQSERPDKEKEPTKYANWLPCPHEKGQLFRLNYRIYLPTYRVQHPDDDVLKYIPAIMKQETVGSV